MQPPYGHGGPQQPYGAPQSPYGGHGQPYGGPPQPYGAPGGAPKKGSGLKIALIIVAVVLLFGVGGLVCLGVIGATMVDDEPSAAAEGDEATNAKAKAGEGPCGHLMVETVKDAFDREKMERCGACCREKKKNLKAFYYHFEHDRPPGYCRCELPAHVDTSQVE